MPGRAGKKLSFAVAGEADAAALAALRTACAERLEQEYGPGHWSRGCTESAAYRAIVTSHVLVGRTPDGIVATLRLVTKKPWAIDPSYFTPVRRPLYLVDMFVAPEVQRQGYGRAMLAKALEAAAEWPSDGVRLDAWDAPAGAGPFYARCGWTERGRRTYRGAPLLYYEYLLPRRSGR